MSLNHVILGLLKKESLSGYEVKKVIQNTPFMYWSGNNNQVYKAFVELLDKNFVTKEVIHQEGSPSKNIYTITNSGIEEFNKWVMLETEMPTFKKEFLIKLALVNVDNNLEDIVNSYIDSLRKQVSMSKKELERSYFNKENKDSTLMINLVYENIVSFYSNELEWAEKVKKTILNYKNEK